MNSLSLTNNKMQFKSQDHKLSGHRLIPQGMKVNPYKVKTITLMKTSETIVEGLRSFSGMVNYLNHFSPALAKLSVPLHRLCK